MSEKLFDLKDLHKLIRPEVSARDRRLFDMRQEQESLEQLAEDRAKEMTAGPPPVPDAQLVFNQATQTMGVAVRGARRVCPLPKGYSGAGTELAILPGNRLIVISPDKSPLLIDPQTGTTRRL
ncbi:hypothetical protein LMG7141_00808 [Ralstonia condita]|uniref:Uncharacterized protein n=1 Tax=Ralstonia condita TaxID=3058600 RepID=A0ABN9IFS9_9RALS|nr:hypothetical protein [Ralstonia sp. LMG 7141]CAJ0778852.1 hypothetical protein LMG7141_00808 [Ralstonia sp. LMG 7141]